jgi:hypothetical protein
MRKSEWSFTNRAVVKASPQSVVAWWSHPERADDFWKHIQQTASGEGTHSETVTDEARLEDSWWTDSRGWKVHHHLETPLTPREAGRNDGRFIALGHDVLTIWSPTGAEGMCAMSDAMIQFKLQGAGDTEVKITHKHTVSGPKWRLRRYYRKEQVSSADALFKDLISRCQGAIRS